jgi:carbonic anhydrase
VTGDFDDLLAANARFAEAFTLSGFDGVAHAGVGVVTCMDSRIAPLGMLGLSPGDAKILRNPGGRVTDSVATALVISVHLLGVRRILIVPHTRCAVASTTAAELRAAIGAASGRDTSGLDVPSVPDQDAALREDVMRLREHPLIPATVRVGGFRYDVDTGRLEQRL